MLSPGDRLRRPPAGSRRCDPVGFHLHFALPVDVALRVGHEELQHQLAAAAIDDVLRLEVVAVHRADLVAARDHDLLGIELAAPLGQVAHQAVAHREQEQAELAELAAAVVGDVPAETRLQDSACLAAALAKLLDAPIGEGRQQEAEGADEIVRLLHDPVDFGTFHRPLPTACFLCPRMWRKRRAAARRMTEDGCRMPDVRQTQVDAAARSLASSGGNGNMSAGERNTCRISENTAMPSAAICPPASVL